jgi:hypothetical protein
MDSLEGFSPEDTTGFIAIQGEILLGLLFVSLFSPGVVGSERSSFYS